MDPVDVADVLSALSKMNPGPDNWRTSIVDLMKLLGLNSDLAARKQLAAELGYAGDTSDTATMNVWLHKQVMAKLAANGGIVPVDMTHGPPVRRGAATRGKAGGKPGKSAARPRRTSTHLATQAASNASFRARH